MIIAIQHKDRKAPRHKEYSLCLRAFVSLCFKFFLILTIFAPLSATEIPFELELARTKDQRTWGLMNRTFLPENRGMLFYFPDGCIWMFNTWIDLSVAFIDTSGKIIEIADLKSHPEMMDPLRPVNNLKDLRKYPYEDPIYQFFLREAKTIPCRTKYILEMNKGWFKKHNIQAGDSITWDPRTQKGCAYNSR